MKKQVESKFERWINGKDGNVCEIPIARINWRQLYTRAIWRIPPFALDAKNPDNEKGFRDALIYETVVDLTMNEQRDVNVAFVSNDLVLRTSVAERLKDQKRFLPFESLTDFSSYIKLTREQLTKEFIGKIVRRAAEKSYSANDVNCVWNKDKIWEKLEAMKDVWRIDETAPMNLSLFNQPLLMSSLVGMPAITASPTPRWTQTSPKSWYLGPHEFVKTSGVRTYHWTSTVRSLTKYSLSDGQVASDERIQIVLFKVLWKADVKADARFQAIELEDIKLESKAFRAPTPSEVQLYALDSYNTPEGARS
jgi:hypothetical protein